MQRKFLAKTDICLRKIFVSLMSDADSDNCLTNVRLTCEIDTEKEKRILSETDICMTKTFAFLMSEADTGHSPNTSTDVLSDTEVCLNQSFIRGRHLCDTVTCTAICLSVAWGTRRHLVTPDICKVIFRQRPSDNNRILDNDDTQTPQNTLLL